MTGVLHNARVSTVEVIVSSDKWMKMLSFKLGIKRNVKVSTWTGWES